MKMLSVLRTLFTSRRAALVGGLLAVGTVAGLVLALMLFSAEKPVFESHAVILPYRPPDTAPELTEHDWLEAEATALRRRAHLEQAAAAARMDRSRGLSLKKCADELEDAVSVSVSSHYRSRIISERMEGDDEARAEFIRIVMRGPDAMECANVVKAIVDVRAKHFHTIAQQLQLEDPAYREWIVLARRAASLQADVIAYRAMFLQEMEQAGTPVANLGWAELLNCLPPQIVKPTHDAYCAASRELDSAKQQMEAATHYRQNFFEVLEAPRPSATAVGPRWWPYAARWSLTGAAAGMLAGLLLAARGSRQPGRVVLPVPAEQF